jgi:2-methylcitrate dehydratase
MNYHYWLWEVAMTLVEKLADFVERSSFTELSGDSLEQLKLRVLDSLGSALGALAGEPVRLIRQQVDDFGGNDRCTLIGGGRTAPDRAALYNSALVRYLDFNDSYLAKNETCHPSDNFGAVLAAAEYANTDGKELLTALAVAYQVQCRLSDVAPVRAKGFDHTTQGSYAVAAGVSRALGLDAQQTANALAISGTAFNALRVTRTGALSHWKGLAYPNTAFGCTHAAFLAMRGVTGPPQVFEGNKGFMDSIAGPFEIDWGRENLERVRRTITKKYNAEIHSQATIEGVLELKEEHGIAPQEIEKVHIDTFDVAFNIIGGGEEGDKTIVSTKEEADHSLQYMVAAALLDGQLLPDQYRPQRIESNDVQGLLRKVEVRATDEYSKRFPDEMACRITIEFKGGRSVTREKKDYEGFHTRPVGWDTAGEKFTVLSHPFADEELQKEILSAIRHLEERRVTELTGLLARVKRPR